ncbi:hypothetical protein [Emticicia sp. SJ17W-69]|uniref:hypothetical protein n=1 Tax=Emticicia sp. SJ17W-69 TaxID=3421657 RepID=UPI003EB90CDC
MHTFDNIIGFRKKMNLPTQKYFISYRSLVAFFLLFFAFFGAISQKLSNEQINHYLNDLQKEQIISEYGKDAFLKTINKENKILNQRMAGSPLGTFGKIPDSLIKSRTAILGFVGIFELMRNVGSAADEMIRLREMSEKMLGERMFFKPELEGEINPKNPLTFLGAELNLRPSKENYLTIANRLKAINLIDQKVYDELLIWLKKDQILLIKDFGFFIYAAKQTYFYDNYDALKAQQLTFIDSLRSAKLLNADKAKALIDSYKPYELKSKIDILTNCENVVIIPAEQGNLTREEIYQNLFNQVKSKLIPEFNFEELSVSEITKKVDANQNGNMMGIPFANPFAKNKLNYKLSYKVENNSYLQKADTDFSLIKTLQKTIPPDVHIDSSVIKTYANVFSFLTGITGKDFQSINDFLTDKSSSKRLIVIGNDYNPFIPVKESRKVLMLVDSSQNLVFRGAIKENPAFSSFFGDKVDFSHKFSKINLNNWIDDFQQNDILPNLTQIEKDKIIAELRFEPNNRRNIKRSILLSFPQIIAKVNFSPKTTESQVAVFKNFITELSRISHGQFVPEKVVDNFETEIPKGSKKDRVLKINYRLNGKKYESTHPIPRIALEEDAPINPMYPRQANIEDNLNFNESEWLGLVNRSLEENAIDGQFYKIKSGFNYSFYRNDENYIFLTKSQASYIEKKHVEVFKETETPNLYGNYQEQVSAFSAEAFADALKRENMLSNEQSIDVKKAKEPSDILKYSTQAVVIDMNELLGKSDTELYTYILNKLATKLIPEAKFSEIKYLKDNIDDTSNNDFSKHNISVIINGKVYEQTLNISLKHNIQNALDSLKKENAPYFPSIGENQFKVINDFLTDIASPKRLVIVCDYRSPKLSFVLFDSTQATLVAETLPNNYVDFLMYDRQFSRDTLQSSLSEFSRMGFIEKLSNEEKEAIIVKFRRYNGNGINLLETLPKIVVQTNIWDADSYKNVFKDIIDSLKTITKGQFLPTNLVDNFAKTLKKSNYSDRNFKYSFVLNGKKYEESQFVKALPKVKKGQSKIDYEYFDFDTVKFINLVNRSLTENNSAYTFYEIFSEEEEGSVGPKFVFLNSKQYRWLKNKYPEIFELYNENNWPDNDELKEEK